MLARFDANLGLKSAGVGKQTRLIYGEPIASEAGFEEVSHFDHGAYADGPSANIPRDLFQAWWREFPNGLLASFEDGHPFAVVGIFPVTTEWSEKFLSHEMSEHDLMPADIRQGLEAATGLGHAVWYLSGLSSRKTPEGISTHLPRLLGFALLNWVRLNPRLIGLQSFSVVSEGTTAIGLRLLESLGKPIANTAVARTAERPRIKIHTNAIGILDLLASEPLFARIRELQDRVRLTRQALA